MKHRHRVSVALMVTVGVSLSAICFAPSVRAQRPPMTTRAQGTFDVTLAPQKDAAADEAGLGRMLLDKQYHGDLEGAATGQMLAAGPTDKGSGVYVAIEKVTGTLHGKRGTFALQHRGVTTRGAQQLEISVVPDSGTGDLAGLTGTMNIIIADGKHSYAFDYTIKP